MCDEYSKSHLFGEFADIAATFARDGVVVVRDVLSPCDVADALDELWTSPQLLGRPSCAAIKRDSSASWTQENGWPQKVRGSFRDAELRPA
jgi:hypothetical protein